MHSTNLRYRQWLPFLAVVLFLCPAGCDEKAGIETYQAPRSDVHISPLRAVATPQSSQLEPPTGDDAYFIVMVQRDELSWFYKAKGDKLAVAQQLETLLRIIGGVEYVDDTATWNVPEGWEETLVEQTSAISRLATLSIGEGQRRVELAISKFPRVGDDQDEWELINVNRWLGEIGFAPVTAETLDQVSRREPFAGGTGRLFFKVGQFGHPPTMDPLAEAVAQTEESEPAARSAPSNADGLSYSPPEEWDDGEVNSFRFDAFVVTEGEKQAEITVFEFPPSDMLPNVNRWRDELGLPAQSADEMAADMQTLMVAGNEVPYFEMSSPATAEKAETTLAVIVDAPVRQWYFKLRGDPDLVAAEKQRFEDFIEAIEFE